MADDVAKIRDSIVRFQGDQAITDPFDAIRARKLYLQLFGPIDADVQEARQQQADADPFDMRGVDWLGRGREISISVGPRAFLDMRAIAPSHARRAYLGLGTNTPVWSRPLAAVADECDWPLVTWER